MKAIAIIAILWSLCADVAWSQGREDPLAKGAYAEFGYYSEGYYRGYLDLIRKAEFSLPHRDAVSVIGQVEKPGAIRFREGLTASQAVTDAGGVTSFGDRRHVGVWKSRDGRFVIFDMKTLAEEKSDSKDPALEEGDMVIVLERRINF